MILIGSRALMFRAPNLLTRPPKDFDFIGSSQEIDSWVKSNDITDATIVDGKLISENSLCEFEIVEPGSSAELLVKLVDEDPATIQTGFGKIPNLNLLFTIKSSHKYKKNSPHFWKNCIDFHRMKMAGATMPSEYLEFFKLREKESYNYSLPKLNKSKKDFFSGDSVPYIYNHDDLHLSVKHLDKPAYTYYAKDDSEVMSDKAKFFACSREIQLYGVVEEAATLALERSLIPHPGAMSERDAWMFALSKVCSSITSGFFREFAYLNILDVIKLYPEGYLAKFQKDLVEGKIGSFKELKCL